MEQHWQAMFQLHLSDQQFYNLPRCDIHQRFERIQIDSKHGINGLMTRRQTKFSFQWKSLTQWGYGNLFKKFYTCLQCESFIWSWDISRRNSIPEVVTQSGTYTFCHEVARHHLCHIGLMSLTWLNSSWNFVLPSQQICILCLRFVFYVLMYDADQVNDTLQSIFYLLFSRLIPCHWRLLHDQLLNEIHPF